MTVFSLHCMHRLFPTIRYFVLTSTSKRSPKSSVDYVGQREALCRLVDGTTSARSTFSLEIHIPALSGSCVPFTRYYTPFLVTGWPTTTTLSSLASDDCSVGTPGSLTFALSALLPSFCFVTESNHCNKGELSWLCSVTVAFDFRQYKGREPGRCL